jgi:uncharacterized protein YgbK (DUF1537 family)
MMSAPKPLLAFYADDFTGATDVLDVLSRAGISTLLLFDPEHLDVDPASDSYDVVGVAGTSRAMDPQQMDRELPPVLRALLTLEPALLHYKVCSTFDSAPAMGSIGKAAELISGLCGSLPIPVVVGVPALGRYTAFGHLFARAPGEAHPIRIDRHPVMSRHPVTPMTEADLTKHLAAQTDMPVSLIDSTIVHSGLADREGTGSSGARLVVVDIDSERAVGEVGNWLWRSAQTGAMPAVIGSSGVEYALVKAWQRDGYGTSDRWPDAPAANPVLVVSGSCSPTTAAQLNTAVGAGFREIRWDVTGAGPDRLDDQATVQHVIKALTNGESVVVRTDLPAHDGLDRQSQGRIVAALGAMTRQVVASATVRRIAVCGGDTSGAIAQALGLTSARMLVPTALGAPTCVVTSRHASCDGLEVAFKGGQMGQQDYLLRVASGASMIGT